MWRITCSDVEECDLLCISYEHVVKRKSVHNFNKTKFSFISLLSWTFACDRKLLSLFVCSKCIQSLQQRVFNFVAL
jgi:hypothetical protein